MKIRQLLILPAALVLATACGKDDSSDKRVDDALNSDLSLAGQVTPAQPLDSISGLERGYAETAPVAVAPTTARRSPATTSTRRTSTRRTSSSGTRRSSGSSAGTYEGSSSGTYSAPAPAPQRIVKNTKRDAAIGAAAGAIIGATTSRNKVKGAVIGATAGGILGAVIGNNVDVQRK